MNLPTHDDKLECEIPMILTTADQKNKTKPRYKMAVDIIIVLTVSKSTTKAFLNYITDVLRKDIEIAQHYQDY